MIGDIEVLPEEQSEVDSQVFATDWDEFLEHVGNALQDQDFSCTPPINKGCWVAPEDLDALMQYVDKALHGKETGEALDYFMADVNCSLHGHMKRDTEIDCMLHQVRRNLNRHRRSVQLSTASTDMSKQEDLASLIEETSDEVNSPEVQGRHDDQMDIGTGANIARNETLESIDDRPDNKTPLKTFTVKNTPQRSVSAPDLPSTVKLDRGNDSDSLESSGVNNKPDPTDGTRTWMRLTRLSLAFAFGVAIGMIIIKCGI